MKKMGVKQALKSLDAFPRAEEHLLQKTQSGAFGNILFLFRSLCAFCFVVIIIVFGIENLFVFFACVVSVVGLLIMATLFLHELRYYLTTYTVHQVRKFQMLCHYKRIETWQLDANGMIRTLGTIVEVIDLYYIFI